jgi:hypothetical protein
MAKVSLDFFENDLGSIEEGKLRGPRRAGSRLLQRERCGHAQDAPGAHVVDGEIAYDAGVIWF